MELWDTPADQLEGEVDQKVPAGKYVLRFLRATDKVKPLKDDPQKEGREVYINWGVVRPVDGPADFNAAKYESLLLSFRDNQGAQLIRFMKTGGWDPKGGTGMRAYLASQVGRQYVADVSYSTSTRPDANGNFRDFLNIRGIIPLDVYESRMSRFTAPAADDGGELE